MFLQTVGRRDYIFHCLGARRDGSIDVKEKITQAKKTLINRGFLAFMKFSKLLRLHQKITHRELIHGVFYCVVCRN